jgi:hypothetical protein
VEAATREKEYCEIFTCASAKIPMNYLGMPTEKKRLAKSQWGPVDERFAHKLSRWKVKCCQWEID